MIPTPNRRGTSPVTRVRQLPLNLELGERIVRETAALGLLGASRPFALNGDGSGLVIVFDARR